MRKTVAVFGGYQPTANEGVANRAGRYVCGFPDASFDIPGKAIVAGQAFLLRSKPKSPGQSFVIGQADRAPCSKETAVY